MDENTYFRFAVLFMLSYIAITVTKIMFKLP